MKTTLKKMMLAAAMCLVLPMMANAQVCHVGDVLCEGGVIVSPANYEASGLEAEGVVFYVDATGLHGWAVALQDAGSCGWGPTYNDTPLANFGSTRQAIYDLDGYSNTAIVRNCGDASRYPAFYAVDFENGWYLPAIGQLNYLYGNLVEVNATLQLVEGTPFNMNGGWIYWSSTENSDIYAWYLESSGALIYYDYRNYKHYIRRVRGVKAF